MKKNLAPILVVAFVMAIICTGIFYGLVAGRLGASTAQANASSQILVAAKAISRGDSITALDVRTAPWTGAAPEGALRLPSEVTGLTALSDFAPGEPLLSSRLLNKASGGGLGIPSGLRAISVRVQDSSGVVSLLKTGHHVDVQAVYSRSGSNQDAEIRTVLENIEVLKIDAATEPAPGKPAGPVATLLVTPSEADTVGLADAVARVRLVLRNPLDAEKLPRESMSVAGLMNGSPQNRLRRTAVASAPPAVSVSRPPAPSGLSLASGAGSQAACDPPKSTGGEKN